MTAIEIGESKPHARRTVLLLKGTDEYAQWVAELSRATRIPRATLVDLALTYWARKHGHPAPPTRLSGAGRAGDQERSQKTL
jgi:hypothetical protein